MPQTGEPHHHHVYNIRSSFTVTNIIISTLNITVINDKIMITKANRILTIDVSQHLTVEEAMKVAADLKLGERMTQGEKDIVSI